ncbi:MAG: SoxY-related AACIE arm protein [Alphaproteobacteria bacterium]|nr:SoxY-related AACIE arm protein [Alphaproteobacteria bacterium]
MSYRRAILAAPLALLLAPPARATPEAMREAMRAVLGTAAPRPGGIALDVPPLVDNGNAVPLEVIVDSPMTDAAHVRAIHVFNEKNPQPLVFHAWLGPASGRARVATRIKLGDSQRVAAIAAMSDGTFRIAEADVIVTLAACFEELT